MQTDTPTPIRRRGADGLALAFFVLAAALGAVAVLSTFARYFLGDQIPLIVDVATSSHPQLAVADGGE